jgi:hypothetical protein
MTVTPDLVVTALVSGAAAGFVKETMTTGSQWLRDRFAHHKDEAQKKAGENASDFLNELAPRIKNLEENSDFLKQKIETAMSQPDFSMLMQQAILSAAQTESKEKHILLAQVVSERLRADADSLLALTSQMACEAISHMTSQQLRVLGLHYTLEHMRFPTAHAPTSPELLRMLRSEWIEHTLAPYKDLHFSRLDLMHLDSLGCLGAHHGFLSPDLAGMLSRATGSIEFEYERFVQTGLGRHILELFERQGLNGTSLQSTGSLIGMYVSDQLANKPTDITTWEA